MLKLMGKKIFTILRSKVVLFAPMFYTCFKGVILWSLLVHVMYIQLSVTRYTRDQSVLFEVSIV